MAKILNLDTLEPPKRYLSIGGKKYEVEEMTVDNFLVTSAAAERLKGETDSAKQIEATIEMLVRSIPTVPVEILRKMSLERLQVVVAFVRGDDELEGVEEGEVKDGKAGK